MTPALAPPEEQQIDAAAQGQEDEPYGPYNRDLPEQIVNAFREQVKEFQGRERYLRRREVMRDRRCRFYERGVQHIYWNNQGQSGGFCGYSGGSTITNANGQSVQAPRFVDDYNIFQRYLQINASILTQTSPGIDFLPNDAEKAEDQEAAETAELYRHYFDRANDVSAIRMETVRMFGLSGRCVRWTRSVEDPEKYGTNPEGTPKQVEISTVHGTLESKVPLLSKCQSEALYCFLADDPDVKQAKAEYPDFADKIKAGEDSSLGENAYERLARLGVLQGSRTEMLSNDSYTHLVTRTHCWLRPACFTGDRYDDAFEEGDAGDGQGMTLGQKIAQLFPEGVKVCFVGDTYVGSCAESMDDALCIEFPYAGDGMNRIGFMEPMVVVQDSFNDAMNAAREVFDVGWPSTWVDAEDQDFDAMVNQRADPYALRQAKAKTGQPMAGSFYREPNPELPETFVGFMENLSGPFAQFILAAPPALFGAAMEDQKTASGYAQARAQAMGQQGLIYSKLQHMDARMYYQAALCASKNPDESRSILIPDGSGSTMVELGKIAKGKFGAYPDMDSSFPESQAAKRATWDSIITLIGPTPIGEQIVSVPKNVKSYFADHGMSEIVVPEAESYDKQTFEIEELLHGSPIPPDPMLAREILTQHASASIQAVATGQPEPPMPPPPQPQPSVPVNDWDFHQWEAAACQDWLNSSACRREQAAGNLPGVENVVAHWRAHVARIPPPMPTPPLIKPAPVVNKGGPGLVPAAVQPPGAPGMATM